MRQELLCVTTKIKGVPSTTRDCAEVFPNDFEAWLVCCSKGQFSSEVSSGRQRYTLGAASPTSIVLAHVSLHHASCINGDASSPGWQSDCKCILLRRVDDDGGYITTVGVFHSAWERRGAPTPWCTYIRYRAAMYEDQLQATITRLMSQSTDSPSPTATSAVTGVWDDFLNKRGNVQNRNLCIFGNKTLVLDESKQHFSNPFNKIEIFLSCINEMKCVYGMHPSKKCFIWTIFFIQLKRNEMRGCIL
jgi:hypothetical protein